MKPFKLRIDWTLQHHYGDPVEVELHIMGRHPKLLRTFPTVPRAVDWTILWFKGRGLDYWCDIDLHQRLGHTYITLHPRPISTPTPAPPTQAPPE